MQNVIMKNLYKIQGGFYDEIIKLELKTLDGRSITVEK